MRDKLARHLSALERQGLIAQWHDRRISAGQEWQGTIDMHLKEADIILLLISADFIASDYCYGVEVKQAMERHEAGLTRIIPVLLRPTDWQGTPFSKLQALPKDAKPITTWSNLDEAFFDVTLGLRRVIEDLSKDNARSSSASSVNLLQRSTEKIISHESRRAKTSLEWEAAPQSQESDSSGILFNIKQHLIKNGFEWKDGFNYHGQEFRAMATKWERVMGVSVKYVFLFAYFHNLTTASLKSFSKFCYDNWGTSEGLTKSGAAIPVAITHNADRSCSEYIRNNDDSVFMGFNRNSFPVIYDASSNSIYYFERTRFKGAVSLSHLRGVVKKFLIL